MMKTGSELMSDIVGPAGSMRNEGDFSCSTAPELEDELWRELPSEDWALAACGKRLELKQMTAAKGTN